MILIHTFCANDYRFCLNVPSKLELIAGFVAVAYKYSHWLSL